MSPQAVDVIASQKDLRVRDIYDILAGALLVAVSIVRTELTASISRQTVCFSFTSEHFDPSTDFDLHSVRCILHQGRQGPVNFHGLLPHVIDALVDVDLDDAPLDTVCEDTFIEAVGSVQHQTHVVPNRRVDLGETFIIKANASRSIAPVHVAERRREPVDARVDETARLRRVRHQGLERARVRHAVLATFDAAWLGLGCNAAGATIRHELARPGQVLVGAVVRHVDHDAVVQARVGRGADCGRVRGMVEVHGDWHGRGARAMGGNGRKGEARV